MFSNSILEQERDDLVFIRGAIAFTLDIKKKRMLYLLTTGGLCNGSTADSGSACEGSSPSPPAFFIY